MHENTPRSSAHPVAPSHGDAQDEGAPCRVTDWQQCAAAGGEIRLTIVATCDACDAIADVHVIGPCGGVLAFCADADACVRRQRRSASGC